MPNAPTFQDLLDDFSEEVFIGRTDHLTLFEKALTAPRPPFLILSVYGQGGVGKTTLTEQFQRVANDHGVPTALTNEHQNSIPTALSYLAHQLAEGGHKCATFEERYRKYRELKDQIEADPKAPTGILDFAVRSATKIGLRSLNRLPIIGEAKDVLLGAEAEDVIANQANAFTTYIIQKFSNKDEKVLLLETDHELTRHFLTDLSALAQTKRVILFFDTYELTAPYLDEWLRKLLQGEFGKFSGTILFVISGRNQLAQPWTRFKKAIQEIGLNEFTDEEAREYLSRFGVSDEPQVTQLIELSNRLPVLLALLASASGGDAPTHVYGSAVERFLQGTNPEQRDAALVASVPRFFNEDILKVILASEGAAATAFAWLCAAPFVRSGMQGWSYHQIVRSLMLRYFRLRSSKGCAEVHAKLAGYYRTQAEALGISEKTQRDNETWRRNETERLYHHLSQNTTTGLLQVLDSFLSDTNNQDKSVLQSHVNILTQVAEEVDDKALETWAQRIKLLSSPSNETPTAEELKQLVAAATTLCEFEGLQDPSRSSAYALRGNIHQTAKDFASALADFSKAIELQPTRSELYLKRAITQLWNQNIEATLNDLAKALELQPDNSDVYMTRAIVYSITLKEYASAITDINKVIELQSGNVTAYALRAINYTEMKDYAAALRDYNKLIELQPENGNFYDFRGQIYVSIEHYPAALSDFSKAIELAPENADIYGRRSQAFINIENYTAALADLNKALELQPDNAGHLALRGFMHGFMQKHSEAVQDLSQAIALQPANAEFFKIRARIYWNADNLDNALSDISRAIELQPENGDYYQLRAQIHAARQDIPAAVADFSEAIKLQPDNANNYHGRGNSYTLINEFAPALADLDKAIELEPENASYHFSRGNYHVIREDNAAAVADFSKAIELQPENADYYSMRAQSFKAIDGQLDAALSDFTKAVELQPDYSEYFNLRGDAYLRKGNYTAAIADFSKALELNPDDTAPIYNIACAHALQNDAGEACRWLRWAFEIDPEKVNPARADSDFDKIREADEFKTLLAEFDSDSVKSETPPDEPET
ncbi:MAG TPA: tetratricopeptide repeat protein [Pyrinomonadaceae bacterium]|jgi:tetratricopeptide (TPR) repeat protein